MSDHLQIPELTIDDMRDKLTPEEISAWERINELLILFGVKAASYAEFYTTCWHGVFFDKPLSHETLKSVAGTISVRRRNAAAWRGYAATEPALNGIPETEACYILARAESPVGGDDVISVSARMLLSDAAYWVNNKLKRQHYPGWTFEIVRLSRSEAELTAPVEA